MKAKVWLAALVLGLAALSVGATPCAPSATSLCLSGGRFEVSVAWKDFSGNTGVGQAIPLTADTGYFWFFTDSNIELIVKVLDARTINHKFWVFFGALSSVEYDLTVRDSVSNLTKHYHNASGQFASVGDTLAFDESSGVVLAAQERIVVSGTAEPPGSMAEIQKFIDRATPATSAFTPCPERTFGFDLTGCRFHIEVEWDDGHGNTGKGQPVQLTSDTGYFWFFSPSNVELMVKVLDARGIGGKFWVFFGALSNVKYTITIRDTVTRASRTYKNPSGTFASVGDTGAFNGGYSVMPVRDSDQAVSADLDIAGGSVAAVGADGTVFILDVPADALPSPETVTLTPVSRIDHFPFSGGLAAGVEIEPAGLDLRVPAKLTIRPPSPAPPDQILPYSYSRGGEDFILYPRDVDTSALHLPLVKFAGYGIGRGGQGEADAQAARSPAGPSNTYLQRYALEVFRRVSGVIGQAELQDRGRQIYRDAFAQLAPPLGAGGAAGALSVREKAATCPIKDWDSQDWLHFFGEEKQRQMLGIEADPNQPTYLQDLAEGLIACLQEAFDLCVSRTDPFVMLRMASMLPQLQQLGVEDMDLSSFAEGGLFERCMRFEVDFESKMLVEYHYNAPPDKLDYTQRQKYRSAHVPLRMSTAEHPLARSWYFTGGCSLLPEVVTWDVFVKDENDSASCSIPCSGGKGYFNADATWIDISGDDPSLLKVKLLYDPGDPDPGCVGQCVSYQVKPGDFPKFSRLYYTFHVPDLSPAVYGSTSLYMAKDWIPLRIGGGPSQNGEFVAMKPYRPPPVHLATIETSTEETWFFLKHTPDKPLPPCN